MKTTSNKKTINSSAYLLFFALLLASQSGYAQTEVSGGQTGTDQDRYIINSDESNTDAALRLQSKDGSIFNDWMIYNENGDGHLYISNWRSNSHSNSNENDIGEKYFIFRNGSASGDATAGELGINVVPMSGLDINHGNARTGTHAINRPMYVTGPIGASNNGIEFRHYNATQGIGFGYNTVYATGSNSSQELNFQSRGTGNISLKTGGSSDLFINGSSGNVGIGTTSPSQRLDVNGNIKTNAIRVMTKAGGDLHDSGVLMEVATSSYGTIRSYNGSQHLGTIHFFDDTWGNGTPSNSSECINVGGANGVTLGRWDNPTLYANPSGQVAIGTTDIIEGTTLHVDGRVYISENSGAEEGFGSGFAANDNYKDYLLWVEEGIVSADFAIAEITAWPDYVFKNDYDLVSLEKVEEHILTEGHLHTMPSASEIESNGFSMRDMTQRTVKTIEELTLHTIAQEKQIDALMDRLMRLEQMLENKGK